MNDKILQYFTTGKVFNFSWVVLLIFANDYIKSDRTIAIICVVGAIILAAIEALHKTKNADTIIVKKESNSSLVSEEIE